MVRRPTQRTKMWSRDAIVLEDTKGQEMCTLIPPPLRPESKGLSWRHLKDLIPEIFVIQLGHPQKQEQPLLHETQCHQNNHTVGGHMAARTGVRHM